jgi:ribosomal protein S18 acetylase RimI-like enzyme
MPEILIRPAVESDIPVILSLEHDYTSEYVWQLDIRQDEENEINIQFRQIRLPRSVKVEYPRQYKALRQDWKSRSGLLVASMQENVIGYVSLMVGMAPGIVWATDLVVAPAQRRQGVASALILAAQTWTRKQDRNRLILEIQSKNHAAISLARKMGYDFCGFNDRYYMNHDIVLFYVKSVR